MPYVNADSRAKLTKSFSGDQASNAGELNYMFTTLILEFMEKHGTSYQRINDVVGALEGAKLEFYRRVAAPYEEEKIKENGDVFKKTKSSTEHY